MYSGYSHSSSGVSYGYTTLVYVKIHFVLNDNCSTLYRSSSFFLDPSEESQQDLECNFSDSESSSSTSDEKNSRKNWYSYGVSSFEITLIIVRTQEFISALSSSNDQSNCGKFRKLMNLSWDFTYASKSYAKIIISELHVPITRKTIAPCCVGGIAGEKGTFTFSTFKMVQKKFRMEWSKLQK
eukprot:TRINITY_DN11301_c0_g1_i3.p1 TRINITY_DN11301_c0_g1~~TRINITY_DN11301_c0_g1_i3.p1  ORF type:complete len:183 (-),score=27.52 TRINITY_DN11301_c0_g1_i3:87-635(-)